MVDCTPEQVDWIGKRSEEHLTEMLPALEARLFSRHDAPGTVVNVELDAACYDGGFMGLGGYAKRRRRRLCSPTRNRSSAANGVRRRTSRRRSRRPSFLTNEGWPSRPPPTVVLPAKAGSISPPERADGRIAASAGLTPSLGQRTVVMDDHRLTTSSSLSSSQSRRLRRCVRRRASVAAAVSSTVIANCFSAEVGSPFCWISASETPAGSIDGRRERQLAAGR